MTSLLRRLGQGRLLGFVGDHNSPTPLATPSQDAVFPFSAEAEAKLRRRAELKAESERIVSNFEYDIKM